MKEFSKISHTSKKDIIASIMEKNLSIDYTDENVLNYELNIGNIGITVDELEHEFNKKILVEKISLLESIKGYLYNGDINSINNLIDKLKNEL